MKKVFPRYMFLDHVDSFGKFWSFLSKNIFFYPLKIDALSMPSVLIKFKLQWPV